MTRPGTAEGPAGRRALIEATITVVGEHGLEQASTRRIAQEAGVNAGLISYYFGSRAELLLATAHEVIDDELFRVALGQAPLEVGDYDHLLRHVDAHPLRHRFLYEVMLRAQRDRELNDWAGELYENLIESTQASLAAHGFEATRPLARAIVALIDGLNVQLLAVTSLEEALEAYASFVAVLRRAPVSKLVDG
jgi:AcrR family transcriptional regulator